MLKNVSILLAFLLSNTMANSFITKKEYGEMLYKNPRGIGCDKCHGKDGSGSVISEFFDKEDKKRTLFAPSIKFYNAFTLHKGIKKHPSYVPKYFLTTDELVSVSKFLEGES